MRKVYMRLLPFATLSYFLAYIDRINASFAGLTMRGHLDVCHCFRVRPWHYWGYFIFEVPSNLIMEKVGARLWIARIMITWGLLAGATLWSQGRRALPPCDSWVWPRPGSSRGSYCISPIGFRAAIMPALFRAF